MWLHHRLLNLGGFTIEQQHDGQMDHDSEVSQELKQCIGEFNELLVNKTTAVMAQRSIGYEANLLLLVAPLPACTPSPPHAGGPVQQPITRLPLKMTYGRRSIFQSAKQAF